MSAPVVLAHDWFPQALPDNVVLGERSWCYSAFSCLHYRSRQPVGVRVGHDTGIYSGTFFDLGPEGEVEVGSYCTLVGAIFSTNRKVVVADHAFIAHEVVLADGFSATPCGVGEDAVANQAILEPGLSISVGNNSWIGARAILLAGARIGEGAIVGAAAVVDFLVPPYAIVAGNPARIVGWAKPQENSGNQ